ncbi:MAG: omega-hydroxy-beta-dihydromenaquinone-9 sulfotransferase [Acidimicrobiaceae bacterium]|nr:omega-hydroxy-beta-dihydromenaquinone-9 sulfotransferase [Acidimicrobiaceae bacterium]
MIFVGGMPRSGTTLLTQLVGTHPEIYSVPEETRFIVDPDGVGELLESLTSGWAGPSVAGVRIQRFRKLMLTHLVDRDTDPYIDFCMYDYFDETLYRNAVEDFIGQLACCTFEGKAAASTEPGRYVPRWFPEETLVGLARQFVSTLFGGQAQFDDKAIWCEKTPHNLVSPYPRKLFPDAHFLHAVRDPRDVAASIASDQTAHGSGAPGIWGTGSVGAALDWIHEYCRRWEALAAGGRFDGIRMLQVDYEDLVRDPDATMARVFAFVGVDPVEPDRWTEPLDASAIGRHTTSFSKDDHVLFEARVAPLWRRLFATADDS